MSFLKRREVVLLSKKKEEDELMLLEYEDHIVFNNGFEKDQKVEESEKMKKHQ